VPANEEGLARFGLILSLINFEMTRIINSLYVIN